MTSPNRRSSTGPGSLLRTCSSTALLTLIAALLIGTAAPGPAHAQDTPSRYTFDQRDVPLEQALRAFTEQARIGIVYTPALVAGKRSTCTIRDASAEQVLTCILEGTGLAFRPLPSGAFALSAATAATAARPAPAKYTISGYIQDATSGEKLIGATVYAPDLQVGTVTNNYGFYSLTLPAGTHPILYSYIGYEPEMQTLTLDRDVTNTITLRPEALFLDSVVVVADRIEPIQERVRMGVIDVPVEQIEAAPALLGEVDLLKTLQLLPGVKAGAEATSGLYVRGGGPDQNLFLLDGVPIYNVSHVFGFLSVFNTDAVNNVQLTKGGFPARYGGRLSSVIEVNLKEGNMKEYDVHASVGIVASRVTVEGPVVRDRTSFIVSGRRTYADVIAAPFLTQVEEKPVAYFYDLTAKVNHVFSPKDRVYFSIYSGEDRFGIDSEANPDAQDYSETRGRIHWGNVTSALRWNHLFSNKLFSNTTLTYSRYRFGVDVREAFYDPDGEDEVQGLQYFSGIRDWSAKIDFDFIPSPQQYVRFGAGAIYHTFTPSTLRFRGDDAPGDSVMAGQPVDGLEASAYVEDDWQVSRRLAVNLGVHASAFAVRDKLYPSVQPRISARYLLRDDLSAKASFVMMRQYIHLLTNNGIGLPTDLWIPATDVLPPEASWQASAGFAHSFGKGRYEASLEGYYKQMDNLLQYQEGASYAVAGANYENLVATGTGESYGAEVFLQKRSGRTTGWIGYTLSWANRQFDWINQGRPFPYHYDRRHDLNLTLSHRLSDRFNVSMSWVYATGNAITLPIARYVVEERDPLGRWAQLTPVDHYGETNGFRMPAYHRLDLGVNWYFARGPRESYLALGVYNAYNRRNPFFIDFDAEYTPEGELVRRYAVGYALLPIVPSVSYNFKF